MKRLLCIVSGMNAGGAETFLMKLYRRLDRTKYQMDFCVNIWEQGFYDDEIRRLGGKIYHIPCKSENPGEFRRRLAEIVREQHYQYVLKITSSGAGFMDLMIAKKAGARMCAARSSNSSDGGSRVSVVLHRLGRLLYGKFIDVKLAPSDLAAIHTFGEAAYRNGQVEILHNALDLNVYHFSEAARQELRRELDIPREAVVVGHIGRFMKQKNHSFLLDVFAALHQKKPDSVLLLVGTGELETPIREKIAALGLEDCVRMTGVRSDIPALLSAMDVFVFPSLYEGMPNTVIEAQATGLPCLIADTITREADITGLVHYLPLCDISEWASYIAALPQGTRTTPIQDFKTNGYDIETAADQFVKLIFGEDRE